MFSVWPKAHSRIGACKAKARLRKIGGKICYRDEDLDAFIKDGVCHSTSEKTTEAA